MNEQWMWNCMQPVWLSWLAGCLTETVIRLLFSKMSTQISAATNCGRKWTNTRSGELWTHEMANGRTCVFVAAPRWTLDKLLSAFFFLCSVFSSPCFGFCKSLFCHTAFHQCHSDWHAKKNTSAFVCNFFFLPLFRLKFQRENYVYIFGCCCSNEKVESWRLKLWNRGTGALQTRDQ